MKKAKVTAQQVADWVAGTVEGDSSVPIAGIASIDTAGPEDLTFAADKKREARLGECNAGAAIVSRSANSAPMPLIRVDNVQAAVATVLGKLAQPDQLPAKCLHVPRM